MIRRRSLSRETIRQIFRRSLCGNARPRAYRFGVESDEKSDFKWKRRGTVCDINRTARTCPRRTGTRRDGRERQATRRLTVAIPIVYVRMSTTLVSFWWSVDTVLTFANVQCTSRSNEPSFCKIINLTYYLTGKVLYSLYRAYITLDVNCLSITSKLNNERQDRIGLWCLETNGACELERTKRTKWSQQHIRYN